MSGSTLTSVIATAELFGTVGSTPRGAGADRRGMACEVGSEASSRGRIGAGGFFISGQFCGDSYRRRRSAGERDDRGESVEAPRQEKHPVMVGAGVGELMVDDEPEDLLVEGGLETFADDDVRPSPTGDAVGDRFGHG